MDHPDVNVLFSSPVVYACMALGASLAAVTFGYLYTKQKNPDLVNKSKGKDKVKDAEPTNAKSKTKPISQTQAAEEQSPVTTGTWPLEDKPLILPMPENMPEHLKKIIDMGFPGCPIFRRMEDMVGNAAEGIKEETEKEPAKTEKKDLPLEDKPEILPMPENMPENLKKVLDMGFPGCPVFKRMPKATGSESATAKTLSPTNIGAGGAEFTAAEATGAAAPPVSGSVITIPNDLPEDLKKVLEMGVSDKIIKRVRDAIAGDEPLTVDEKSILYAQALKDSLGVDGIKEMATLANILKSPAAEEALINAAVKSCPRGVHCSSHCSCLFKVSQTEKTADGEGDAANGAKPERDPVEYCSHLQSEVKRTKQKVAIDKIEEKMSAEQKEQERQIQNDQLAAIFNLMQNQQEKFGVDSMDEIRSQMQLYM